MKIRVRTRPVWPLALLLILLAVALGVYLYFAKMAGDADVIEINLGARRLDTAETEDYEYADYGYDCYAGAGQNCTGSGAAVENCANIFAPYTASEDDVTISVYDCDAGCVREMALEDYIYCVTASEMPARSDIEALKAQAVAARTYACRKLKNGGCGRGGADICTNSGHCQAWHSAAQLARGWGERADEYSNKVRAAVEATRGLILTYDGAPVNALFHASSGGHTEDVEDVYSEALPYLRGVSSPGEEGYSGYSSTVTLTDKEFRKIAAGLGIEPGSGALSRQVKVESRTEAGGVTLLKIGEGALTGRQARKAFGLRSQNFTVSFSADGVKFSVLGYGHGVGMSQNGADAMAQAGSGFREILLHYYSGVQIENIYTGWQRLMAG